MNAKYICFTGEYGSGNGYRMGKRVWSGLHIGDIVLWQHKNYYGGKPKISFIAGDERNPFVMGLAGTSLAEFDNLMKLIRYDNVTNDILKDIGKHEFTIEETEAVLMTIEEIENELGYKIEII